MFGLLLKCLKRPVSVFSVYVLRAYTRCSWQSLREAGVVRVDDKSSFPKIIKKPFTALVDVKISKTRQIKPKEALKKNATEEIQLRSSLIAYVFSTLCVEHLRRIVLFYRSHPHLAVFPSAKTIVVYYFLVKRCILLFNLSSL